MIFLLCTVAELQQFYAVQALNKTCNIIIGHISSLHVTAPGIKYQCDLFENLLNLQQLSTAGIDHLSCIYFLYLNIPIFV